ncbi:amino acid/polyamine transporter I [Exophiala viscosa]|uniref:amino acid/polyamine transporter I n=1 Tax=Exophiala viscosa TaxID=2486360 RepID=UPI00219927C4|nr:amino acid/polyamine transporter I [Exophiala viscosa]
METTTKADGSVPVYDDALSADEVQLRAQGHVGELPRQFSTFATVAFAFTLTNSWTGWSGTFGTPLIAGGGPAVFFGLVVSAVACTFITLGLAELASAFPSTGGQYHFAFMVSSPKYRTVVAFYAGWLSVFAWTMTAASVPIIVGQFIQNLAQLYHPDYVAARWQTWLIYTVLTILFCAVVILLPKLIPKLEMGFFVLTLLGFVISFITILATSHPKQSAKTVFVDYTNLTGWADGTAFMLGVGTSMYAFLATDGATHLAEEMPNPGKGVPRAMWLTMIIGCFTATCWTFAFMFASTDLDAAASSVVPILTVYLQAFRSRGVATFFLSWLAIIYSTSGVTCFVTAGRLTWAFARDGGLPFSKTFAYTHPILQVPANATILVGIFTILYGLIYIGSTTAFNSFISMAILGLNITYAIPQGIVLLRGRSKVLPARQFDLGPIFGPFCNAFSVLWVLLYSVLFCFPIILPATVDNMNYLSVVLAGVLVIILAMWYGGKRKTFTGPVISIEGLEMLSAANLGANRTGYRDDTAMATKEVAPNTSVPAAAE